MSAGWYRVAGLGFIIWMLLANVTAAWKESGSGSLDSTQGVAGYSESEALRLGARIYREGILANGKPVRVRLQGDVVMDGRVFACELCHRRSGLGASEGSVVVLPTNGENLYRARLLWDTRRRHSAPDSMMAGSRQVPAAFLGEALRGAYDAKSLGHAIRTGMDPSGRRLDSVMPRYELGETDMALLIHYLNSLSASISPGVTDTTIRFATIITEGVSEVDRDAMLSVLEVHIRDGNAQTRNQLQRARRGAFTKREKDASYRLLELSRWELTGPPESWREQLEEYYRRDPVFALLGGIAAGDWAPIHEFSEHHNIPTILPITSRPVVSEENWNTIYYSRGLYQEGEAVARYLRRYSVAAPDAEIIQLYREGGGGDTVARGFDQTWSDLGGAPPKNIVLQGSGQSLRQAWDEVMQADRNRVVLFWGAGEDMELLDTMDASTPARSAVFVSSSLIESEVSLIPEGVRDRVYITYPYTLPGEKEEHMAALRTWLRIKGIPATNLEIQSKMYFLGWMLPRILSGMKSEFYRDYLLEMTEMMADQSHAIAIYPRLSFGPGQRYAAKGCYIVQLAPGQGAELVKKSEWVIY